MIGRLRQLSEPRLRQQAGIETIIRISVGSNLFHLPMWIVHNEQNSTYDTIYVEQNVFIRILNGWSEHSRRTLFDGSMFAPTNFYYFQ